jgi:hypothetical protein
MNTLQRAMWYLAALTIFLFLCNVGFEAFLYTSNRNSQHNTAKALCTFRNDLYARAQVSRQFLKDHPKGSDGITPALIKSSLKNQLATLASLKGLSCPPPEALP